MRILIDTDLIGRNQSGNETYLRGIIQGLQAVVTEHDDLLLVGGDEDALVTLQGPQTRVLPGRSGVLAEITLTRLIRRTRPDVVLAHYNAPWGGAPVIATVVHDASFLTVPQTFPFFLRHRIRLSVSRSVRKSDLIVTVSRFSRDELVRLFPRLEEADVVVTPNAPDPAFFIPVSDDERERVRTRYQLPPRFVFTIGNIQPRKNLARLAEAATRAGVDLIVAGQPGWRFQEVVDSLPESTRLLGRVPTDDLRVLLDLCSVFAYPSLYEGYGLPVIEAMAAGAPVVTSSTSALAEVAMDAAVLVDPESVESIAAGLTQVLSDPREAARLRDTGTRRAQDFSWAHSAQTLYDALEARRRATR
jgi:glycosyltransferase involved in cell wall biosynthesis